MNAAASRWIEMIRFEVKYQLRRKAAWFFFAVFLLPLFGETTGQMMNAQDAQVLFNAPVVLAESAVWLTLIGLVLIAVVAGDAATRDVQLRTEALMHATPLGRSAYLGGRFVGVFIVMTLLFVVIPLAPLVFPLLHPDFGAALVGPTRPVAYLQSFLIVVVPNVFVASALLFGIAAMVRHALGAWLGAMLIAGATLSSMQIIGEVLGQWEVARLFDPLAATALHLMNETWSPADVNARLIGSEPMLLWHRVIWLALAIAVLGVTYRGFRFGGSQGTARLWRRWRASDDASRGITAVPADALRELPVLPTVAPDFGPVGRVRQTLTLFRDSLREMTSGWTWLLLPALILLIVAAPKMLGLLGVPFLPTTDRVLETFGGALDGFRLLIALFAGELVWRERDANMQALADSAPVSDAVRFIGKLLGLWFVTVALHALLMAAGLVIQLRRNFFDFEPGVYVQILFGITLVETLLFGLLALSIHLLVHHKHVGHLVMLLAAAGMNGLAAQFGIEHPLLVYGADPGWRYSPFSGLEPFLGPFVWFQLYWAGWTLLLGVVALLFWVRGVQSPLRERVWIASRRLTTKMTGVAAGCTALVLIIGGFIYYNTNVLNPYRSSGEVTERKAEYERRYKRYQRLPQPEVTATELRVELYPERRDATVHGFYTLTNRTSRPIETIHVATSAEVSTSALGFDRTARVAHRDDDLGQRIYVLDEALAPGDALRMRWKVDYAREGFPANGIDTYVVGNGSFIPMHEWMPHIGYLSGTELTDAGERKTHGLPERPATTSLYDTAARLDRTGKDRINAKTTVGTAADQIAVAPGTLRRTWSDGDRRYFEYATDAPIPPGYAIFSARYAVRTGRAGDVALEVLHHPEHDLNVDRMIRGMQASLEQYEKRFGPYPRRVLRMIEYPAPEATLHAAAGNIWYQELFSLFDASSDERNIDLPYAVVAHEVAHQFQPPLAKVEGAGLLSETFAWYAAMGVVEQELGADHLQRFLGVLRMAYAEPRSRASVPLLRASGWFQSYRKGPFAMYALQEYAGRERVDLAWRRLIEKHRAGDPPFATSLDLYRELKAAIPPHLHSLLVDLLERNTFWELEIRDVAVQTRGDGMWQVDLQVRARKVVVDEEGRETEVPMNDLVEIGVYAEERRVDGRGEPLYLQKHRVSSGDQRITLLVAEKPGQAGIDPRHLLTDAQPENNLREVQ